MQKTIGLADLQRELRTIFEEVAGKGVEYVLTRGTRPEVVLIPYAEFVEFLEWRKQAVSQEFDQTIARVAEQDTKYTAYRTMLASEPVLQQEWDSPEEDAAWANL